MTKKSPIPKGELMKKLRAERKEMGLVKIEVYVKSEHAERVRKYVKKLEKTN